MPYSASKVANEILRLAREEGRTITPLQLIKLVYIAHGWSLVHMPDALVTEPAQAWQYGPVVPSLYQAVKGYRSDPIVNLLPDADPQDLSAEARALIASVYKTYSRYSGTQLSNLTHQPGTPWSVTWENFGQNSVIRNELIRDHYQQLAAA